jgi:hypothetical protein
MRFTAIVLCAAAICSADMLAPSCMGQSTGPAADKIDTGPAETGKADTQVSPPTAPDTAPQVPAPPEQPPPQDQAQKPADTFAPGGTVETVGPGQAISILGKKVVGQDGKAVLGPVIDILVDADGKPRAAVIDFGGFLGVGSRHVAIDWNALKFHLGDHEAPVQLDLDPAQIKAAPEYKEVNANAEVVEPDLVSPAPLPAVAPLSELPIQEPLPPAGPRQMKNAGQ